VTVLLCKAQFGGKYIVIYFLAFEQPGPTGKLIP